MKILRTLTIALLAVGICAAGPINVSLDTSALIGHAAGPFQLDFQLIDGDGSGIANNTVTLSELSFGAGGGFSGSASLSGSALVQPDGTIVLTDADYVNSFTQEFTAGALLQFVLNITQNPDAGPIPDEFTFAILDSTGVEIPTLGWFDTLLLTDITGVDNLQLSGTDPTRSPNAGGAAILMGAPQIESAVPEPAAALLLPAGLAALALLRSRFAKR